MVFRAQIAEIVSAKFMCSVLELEDREGFLPVFRDLWVCLIGLNRKLSIRLIAALKTISVYRSKRWSSIKVSSIRSGSKDEKIPKWQN